MKTCAPPPLRARLLAARQRSNVDRIEKICRAHHLAFDAPALPIVNAAHPKTSRSIRVFSRRQPRPSLVRRGLGSADRRPASAHALRFGWLESLRARRASGPSNRPRADRPPGRAGGTRLVGGAPRARSILAILLQDSLRPGPPAAESKAAAEKSSSALAPRSSVPEAVRRGACRYALFSPGAIRPCSGPSARRSPPGAPRTGPDVGVSGRPKPDPAQTRSAPTSAALDPSRGVMRGEFKPISRSSARRGCRRW